MSFEFMDYVLRVIYPDDNSSLFAKAEAIIKKNKEANRLRGIASKT